MPSHSETAWFSRALLRPQSNEQEPNLDEEGQNPAEARENAVLHITAGMAVCCGKARNKAQKGRMGPQGFEPWTKGL